MERNSGINVLYVRLGRNNDKRDSQSEAQVACSSCFDQLGSSAKHSVPIFFFLAVFSLFLVILNRPNAWNNCKVLGY